MFDCEEDLLEALFYLLSPSLRYSAPLWWQSPERSLLCQPPVAVFPHGWCGHSAREKPISKERYAMSKWPHVFQNSHTHFWSDHTHFYAGVQKYSTQDAVDRKILPLKYFHRGTRTTKVKRPRINITYTHYITELSSDRIFLPQKSPNLRWFSIKVNTFWTTTPT